MTVIDQRSFMKNRIDRDTLGWMVEEVQAMFLTTVCATIATADCPPKRASAAGTA